jgi:protein-S-isoprenylcysteine O-methyltransferase Ste14
MSLVPAFEVGVWHAWIFIIPFLLVTYGLSYLIVDRKASLFAWPSYNKSEKMLVRIQMLLMIVPCIYSIFLPLKLGAAWFYAGLVIYLLGLAFIIMSVITFSGTPLEKPNTTGIYRVSRNPMYFGWFLAYVGIGIASASWPFLLLSVALIILMNILSVTEERFCHEKYGDAYREYMNRTPRWIGIPKSK